MYTYVYISWMSETEPSCTDFAVWAANRTKPNRRTDLFWSKPNRTEPQSRANRNKPCWTKLN